MGSAVKNIKFDPNKEKIVDCSVCGNSIVVGKFAKRNQTCDNCKNIPKGKKDKKSKESIVRKIETPAPQISSSFAKNLQDFVLQLGFEIDEYRRWKKKYPMDGGGIATIYIGVEPGIGDQKPRVEYFSIITQRAVGVIEDFRRIMTPDAASDCEVISAEFSEQLIYKPDIGLEKCDNCGEMTSEYGVNPKQRKVLCIRPKGCFKKSFTNSGAQGDT